MKSEELNILHMTTALRTQLMDIVSDDDLAFSLPNNPTLGEFCHAIGDTESMYINSFKTFKMAWGFHNTEPGLDSSVQQLKAWYKTMDEELDTVLKAIPDADLQTKTIDRGGSFNAPLGMQFHIYREALLIFYGKISVYLCAMGKPVPEQWRTWIG